MVWKGTVTDVPGAVPEGTYDAFPSSISESDGRFGGLVRITFTLETDDEFDGRQVSGISSQIINRKSKLGRWIATIIGELPPVGVEITEKELLHQHCRIVVKNTQQDADTTFASVVEVLPAA